jgi:hypothetical protein
MARSYGVHATKKEPGLSAAEEFARRAEAETRAKQAQQAQFDAQRGSQGLAQGLKNPESPSVLAAQALGQGQGHQMPGLAQGFRNPQSVGLGAAGMGMGAGMGGGDPRQARLADLMTQSGLSDKASQEMGQLRQDLGEEIQRRGVNTANTQYLADINAMEERDLATKGKAAEIGLIGAQTGLAGSQAKMLGAQTNQQLAETDAFKNLAPVQQKMVEGNLKMLEKQLSSEPGIDPKMGEQLIKSHSDFLMQPFVIDLSTKDPDKFKEVVNQNSMMLRQIAGAGRGTGLVPPGAAGVGRPSSPYIESLPEEPPPLPLAELSTQAPQSRGFTQTPKLAPVPGFKLAEKLGKKLGSGIYKLRSLSDEFLYDK